MTGAEAKLWAEIRDHRFFDAGFRRHVPIGPYVADFVCHSARLVIEVDGDQHGTEQAEAYDGRRTAYLERAGYRVVRFSNGEVFHAFEGVMHQIGAELGIFDPDRMGTPHPNPPPQGGRGRKRGPPRIDEGGSR
jgi:very-short-patch-repair endonuclease